ncbi:MAG: phosphoglucosamine mutase [Gammaproteobacteria bacterium]
MNHRKYFGTDGIRGRVGASLINPEFILKLGWAAGVVLSRGHGGKVLIGKDTRISGYMLESALEAGLSAAGIDIHLLGPMPTPGIAYLTRTFRAQAGIVISASHNPYYDNGIKFFSMHGSKLPVAIEQAIELQLDQPMQTVDSSQLGKAVRIEDAAGRYIEFCKSTVPNGLSLTGMKIVIDCANGATYHVADHVLKELGAKVIVIGAEPNGLNINEKCGSTHPGLLQQRVLAEDAHLGIAFDGDGDRTIMVDHKGNIVDGDEILFIIARDLKAKQRLNGGVVGTIMSNFGFELAMKNLGIDFVRSPVGDRYVMEFLKQESWQLGGEPSGHIVNLGLSTTGDGIISALQVLTALCESGKSLQELKQGMQKVPQKLINVATDRPLIVEQREGVKKAVERINQALGKGGRVLLRASGTEPVVRVMIEGEDDAKITQLAQELAHIVQQEAALCAVT